MRSLLHYQFETVVMVADEALLLVLIPKLQPDLVSVDLSMPVAGQQNIVARCGERLPKLGIIVLSVHDVPEAAAAMMRTGARGYVLKRTAATDLAAAIAAVLAGGTYISPSVGSQLE